LPSNLLLTLLDEKVNPNLDEFLKNMLEFDYLICPIVFNEDERVFMIIIEITSEGFLA